MIGKIEEVLGTIKKPQYEMHYHLAVLQQVYLGNAGTKAQRNSLLRIARQNTPRRSMTSKLYAQLRIDTPDLFVGM